VNVAVLLTAPANQPAADSLPFEKLIGVPGAILALFGLAAYAFGLIRPVAITHALYVGVGSPAGGTTQLHCTIKNRKVLFDRTLTGLALVSIPSRWYRLTHWGWRRGHWDRESYVPWGTEISRIVQQGVVIGKRNQVRVDCEIRRPGGAPMRPGERLPDSVRLFAYFGTSRAAMKKPSLGPRGA
jgi:hypothetical protein